MSRGNKITKAEMIQWRKDQIQQLVARGYRNHKEIALKLQIPKSTVSKDLYQLREDSKKNMKNYIDDKLPVEYERIYVGIVGIIKEVWDMTTDTEVDTREKLQAFSLVKDCYAMQLDLLTDPSVIEQASSFIAKYKDKNNLNEIKTYLEDKKEEIKENSSAESNDITSSLNEAKSFNKTF